MPDNEINLDPLWEGVPVSDIKTKAIKDSFIAISSYLNSAFVCAEHAKKIKDLEDRVDCTEKKIQMFGVVFKVIVALYGITTTCFFLYFAYRGVK